MATKKEKTENSGAEQSGTLLNNGVVIDAEIEQGKHTPLDPAQQGAQARGELDENLQVKPKEAPKEDTSTTIAKAANDARTEKEKVQDMKTEELQRRAFETTQPRSVEEKLYVGRITASAVAAATGEKVSVRWDQAMPVTKDGLFYSFRQYHPSAQPETFEVDTQNVTDPTLRTHLERTRPVAVHSVGDAPAVTAIVGEPAK